MDNVLKVMVKGLEHELQARLDGKKINAMAGNYPSPAIDAEFMKQANRKIIKANNPDTPTTINSKKDDIQQQGADISYPIRQVLQWIASRQQQQRQRKQQQQ